MIVDIDCENLSNVKNPLLLSYASTYVDIYDDLIQQIRSFGVEIDSRTCAEETAERMARLEAKGVRLRNDDKSIYINRISPGCVACRTGVGSATFFISLMCNRNCWFCFNPNQENYEHFSNNKRDCIRELALIHENGFELSQIALTGGEPLLHPEETFEFFQVAYERFPDAYTRLYTSGDFIDREVLKALHEVYLNEIRFSIRLHDGERGRQTTLSQIASTRDYIPNVMVEMPVLPDAVDVMKEILIELDELELFGINLLEFCFPMSNAEVYNQRGYKIKNPPFRIPYNYWYAGGLPISQSELTCLELLEFAIDTGLNLGVHYCSLENKYTSQIFQQNFDQPAPGTTYFSEKDFFLKSAKVFGSDIPQAQKRLRRWGSNGYTINREHRFIEFHVSQIEALQGLDIEVGISSSVMETREDGQYLRELKVDLTYPEVFDFETDV